MLAVKYRLLTPYYIQDITPFWRCQTGLLLVLLCHCRLVDKIEENNKMVIVGLRLVSSQTRLLPTMTLYCTINLDYCRVQLKKKNNIKSKKSRVGACWSQHHVSWNVVLTRADWSTSPYRQAGNSLSHFKNGWGGWPSVTSQKVKKNNFKGLQDVFGLGRPLSEDFTGVPTSSRRYLRRRHLDFKMAAPEMMSTRTWGELFEPNCGGGGKWRPLRFQQSSWMTSFLGNRKWGHPRWRLEAKNPPFSTNTKTGVEKFSLYYWYLIETLQRFFQKYFKSYRIAFKVALCLVF